MWRNQIEQHKRRTLMLVVFGRENGRCFYCDVVVNIEARKLIAIDIKRARELKAATLDHLIPKSRDGEDTPENTVCACYGCNLDRGDRPAIDCLYEHIAVRVAA